MTVLVNVDTEASLLTVEMTVWTSPSTVVVTKFVIVSGKGVEPGALMVTVLVTVGISRVEPTVSTATVVKMVVPGVAI
jgi:hypothetical protein